MENQSMHISQTDEIENNWNDNNTEENHLEKVSFKLKHLGKELHVSKQELIELAQKGKDYDRIRKRAQNLADKLTESEKQAAFIKNLAEKVGMTTDEFINTATKKSDTHISPEDKPSENQIKNLHFIQRRDREVNEFIKHYKNINPKDIPQEVWQNVKNGTPLLTAFMAHENKSLKDQLEQINQHEQNKQKAIGPLNSTASPNSLTQLEQDWYRD